MKVDGIAGDITCGYLEMFQRTEGISADKIYGKVSQSKANTYKTVKKTNAQKICDKAKALAWGEGIPKSKYTYPTGSATAAFKDAIAKAYPDRSKWGRQTRMGASCDVFVGTVVRASGYDTSFPRGLDEVEKHCKGNSKWQALSIKDTSKLQPGDVVYYLYKGGGHIYIYVGNGYIANAHYRGKTYGIIQKLGDVRKPSATTKFIVYRAK